jgi:hypothetical protein
MRIRDKDAASGRRKRMSRRPSKRNEKPPDRSSWLTMFYDEGEASETEEESDNEQASGDEDLYARRLQPSRIRRDESR